MIWSICILLGSAVTKLSEVDNECTLHIFIVLAISMPKNIKFGLDLIKI